MSTFDGLGLAADYDAGVIAAGAVMEHLYETQKNSLAHIVTITPYTTGQFMIIDTSTRRNLELVETLKEEAAPWFAVMEVLDRRPRQPWAQIDAYHDRAASPDQERADHRGARMPLKNWNMSYISEKRSGNI